MNPTTRNRLARSLIQVIAGGGAGTLITELANISGPWRGLIAAAGVFAVATAQNLLEDSGAIKDRRS